MPAADEEAPLLTTEQQVQGKHLTKALVVALVSSLTGLGVTLGAVKVFGASLISTTPPGNATAPVHALQAPSLPSVLVSTAAGNITELSITDFTCQAIEERALSFMRMHRLVPQSTVYCTGCGPGFAGPCCVEWKQFGLGVPCEQIQPSRSSNLQVTLSMEVGLEASLALFLRTLPLSASERERLVHILQVDYGLWKMSQLSSIYPTEVVQKLNLPSEAQAHVVTSMLGNQVRLADAGLAGSQTSQVIEPGSGATVGLVQLIDMEGLLRGIRINPEHAETNLEQVVTFQGSIAAMSEAALSGLVVTTPNVATREFVIATSSVESATAMNGMMSAMGTSGVSSASKAKSMSASASGDGASASAGHSSRSGDSGGALSAGGDAYESSLSGISKQYYMSKYFVQPQVELSITPSRVKATEEFRDSLDMLADKHSGYTVEDLFAQYGSHVCLDAILGGYWKVTADLHTTKIVKQVTMSSITSSAISSAVSASSSTSVSGGGGDGDMSASAGVNNSKASSSQSGSEVADANLKANDLDMGRSVLTMKQEWKGGLDHTSLATWLSSLAPAHNSNWKVVDRSISSCIGIWEWVERSELRQDICSQYLTQYLTDMGIFNFSTGQSPSAKSQPTYGCFCNKATLDSTSTTGGQNEYLCHGYNAESLYCSSSNYFCNNPNTVYVNSVTDATPYLCSTAENYDWTTQTTTTTTFTTTTTQNQEQSIQEICAGAADLKTTTERISELVAKTLREKEKAKMSSCDSTPGYHWTGSATSGTCAENTCFCGKSVGATGTACPVDGQTLCLPSQQAQCSSAACPPEGYWFNGTGGTTTTCLTETCSSSGADVERCCAPVAQGNNFLVVVSTSSGGSCQTTTTLYPAGGSSSISATSSPDFKSNTQTTLDVGNSILPGFTPKKICITMDECTVMVDNSHMPSGVTVYNGGISSTASSSNEVGCTFGSWVEFRGDTRVQCSSISPCR